MAGPLPLPRPAALRDERGGLGTRSQGIRGVGGCVPAAAVSAVVSSVTLKSEGYAEGADLHFNMGSEPLAHCARGDPVSHWPTTRRPFLLLPTMVQR